MLVRSPEQVDARDMDMPGARGVKMRLMVGRGDGAPNFAMRLFEVAPGGQTPKHAHNYEHEVLIVDGQAKVYDGEADTHRDVAAGDTLYIPANQTHQFLNQADRPLKFMCMVPTRFDCGGGATNDTPGS